MPVCWRLQALAPIIVLPACFLSLVTGDVPFAQDTLLRRNQVQTVLERNPITEIECAQAVRSLSKS
jgi:hypothetical protein